MSSEAKKNKARNSYIYNGGMKSKKKGIKRIDFYTASDRQKIKKEAREEMKGADGCSLK